MGAALQGRRIVVPETRELDLLARMIAAEGGEAVRCPLVAIVDAPDPAPVREWLYRFRDVPCDDLILLTGEGLRRLHDAAREARYRPRCSARSAPPPAMAHACRQPRTTGRPSLLRICLG